MKILLAFVMLLPFPIVALAQSGSSVEFGDTTFYNYSGLSGTSQQFGNTEFYNFNNGHSAALRLNGFLFFPVYWPEWHGPILR